MSTVFYVNFISYYLSPEFDILMCVHSHLEAFKNYFIKSNLDHLKVIENPYSLPWSAFIGVLGMPGKSSGYSTVNVA